jgi:phosphoribosylaminoimidazole-succinocarboxamide synthase
MPSALFESNLHSLPLIARGKVRDNYAVGDDRILMVASDRISAFDVVMGEPIPGKGETLTRMALFWFDRLAHVVPNHLTGVAPETVVAADEVEQVRGRSMLVMRLKPLPIEAVVRGYLAGSGWKEYQAGGTVCGIALPKGLQQASRLPEPIFTPATKAEAGTHDENISFEQAAALIGSSLAAQVRDVAIRLYREAAAYALTRGIVIADTKFEFGLDEGGMLTLMDEVLTPDSSRFWPVESYREGISPPSYDKQYLRDWLESVRIGGKPWSKRAPAPRLSEDVVTNTQARYLEAFQKLTARPPVPQGLLARLESLAKSATSVEEQICFRAQWAGAMARLGSIDATRSEIAKLRQANASFAPRPTAWILLAEGLADHFDSLSTNALDKFKRAHALASAMGDAELKGFSAAWLSASEFLVGAYDSAVTHALEAIQRGSPGGEVALSRAHLVLANILYTIGLYREASAQYAKARSFAIDAHDISMQSVSLYNVAAFRIARISLENALGKSVDSAELKAAELELNSIENLDAGLGVHSLRAMIPILRAQLSLVQERWEEADQHYSRSIPEAATYGQLRWEPRFLAEQSHARAMLGQREEAMRLVRRAIESMSDRVDVDDLAACHARISLTLGAIGDADEGAAHLNKARTFAESFAARQSDYRRQLSPLLGIENLQKRNPA